MNTVLFHVHLHGIEVGVSPWKLVGYLGVLLFGSRWLVQLRASRRAGTPVMPRMFWYMSVAGSGLLLSYFIFAKNDSVGVLSNLLPAFTAGYNLWLDVSPARNRSSLSPRKRRTWRWLELLNTFINEVFRVIRTHRSSLVASTALVCLATIMLHPFDYATSAWLHTGRTPAALNFARRVSYWGELHRVPGLVIAALLVGGWIRKRRYWTWAAGAGVLAAAISGIVVNLIKVVIGRPRPSAAMADGIHWFSMNVKFHGFPSGHATHCTAVAIAVGLLAPRAGGALFGGSLVVMWARWYLERHYVTDLLVGAWLGTITGIACGLAARRLLGEAATQEWTLAAQPRLTPAEAHDLR